MKSFVQKFGKKLGVSIMIVSFLFLIYFIGSCNGKKHNQVSTKDTTQIQLKALTSKNVELLTENNMLKTKIKTDSIKIVAVEIDRKNIKIQYIDLTKKIQTLSLDSAILYMATNLRDKTPITYEIQTSDTIVGITPNDVKDINNCYVSKNYYTKDNNMLKSELALMTSKDSSKTEEILNYEEILKNKDKVIVIEQEQDANLNKSLTLMTKKYKRQKFVCEGLAGALLIFSLLK